MSHESKWIASSQVEVAEFFGVSVETIRKEWRARGMPGRKGRYDLSAITQWRRKQDGTNPQVKRADPEQAHLKERLELAEVLKAEADAKIKDLKYREACGELVDRAAAKAAVEEIFHSIRNRMESIPQEIGTTVPPEIRADVMADMRQKIGLILREMEAWGDDG